MLDDPQPLDNWQYNESAWPFDKKLIELSDLADREITNETTNIKRKWRFISLSLKRHTLSSS